MPRRDPHSVPIMTALVNDQSWRHLCVDMQRIFAEDTPWRVEWMGRVAPVIAELAGRRPEQTIFTRFIPPATPEDAQGAWRDYYRKWDNMTRARMPAEMIDLIEQLNRFVPPAKVLDKPVYSPWFDGQLHRHLTSHGVRRLVISGGETDVCVLAAVLGAIDLGYFVTLVSDAVCSGADETHDASLTLLASRFSLQVELATAEEILRDIG